MSTFTEMRVAAIIPPEVIAKQVNFRGAPPDVTGGTDERTAMKQPAYLVIARKGDGIFLDRFASDGEDAGDTWHASVEAAKKQAAYECGDHEFDWIDVPDDVADVLGWLQAMYAR
jgi:hypothetical protein